MGDSMFTLPNLLSIIRIILIPLLIKFLLIGDYMLAGIIFTISAITDFLDGYLARKYRLTSEFGRILDPFADKLTIISILIVLVINQIIPRFITIIILTRELFIFISSGIIFLLGKDFINPSYIGKLSTFLLYLAIIFRLINIPYIDMALFYVVIPLNIISGVGYIISAYKKLSVKS